eukprot:scaffold1504_cov417-Prasinococcus_capsulatus_cf.AAC.72
MATIGRARQDAILAIAAMIKGTAAPGNKHECHTTSSEGVVVYQLTMPGEHPQELFLVGASTRAILQCMGWSRLPSDILSRVLSLLCARDAASAALVCSQWARAVSETVPWREHYLKVRVRPQFEEEGLLLMLTSMPLDRGGLSPIAMRPCPVARKATARKTLRYAWAPDATNHSESAHLPGPGLLQAWGMRYRVDSLYGHPVTAQVRSIGVAGEGEETVAVSGAQDGSVVVWKLSTGLPLSSRGPSTDSSIESKGPAGGSLRALSLYRDVLVAGEGSRLKVWLKHHGEAYFDVSQNPIQMAAHSSPISTVHVSRNAILSGGWDQKIRMWSHEKLREATDMLCLCSPKSSRRSAVEAASACFLAEWTYSDWVWKAVEVANKVVCSSGRLVSARDAETGTVTHAWAGVDDGQVPAVATSCCGQLVFTGSDDGCVRLWDLRDRRVQRRGKQEKYDMPRCQSSIQCHGDTVNDLSFSDPMIASASSDGSVILSDMRKWVRPTTLGAGSKSKHNTVRRLFPTRERAVVYCCQISPSGYLVSGAASGPMRVWDFTRAIEDSGRRAAARSRRQQAREKRRTDNISVCESSCGTGNEAGHRAGSELHDTLSHFSQ